MMQCSKYSIWGKGLSNPVHEIWASTREKPVFGGFVNNTGADQPAHMRSLISAFVIRFLEGTICRLATDEISIF